MKDSTLNKTRVLLIFGILLVLIYAGYGQSDVWLAAALVIFALDKQ